MDENSDEKQQYTAFEKITEFTYHLEKILMVDTAVEPSTEEDKIEFSHLEKLFLILSEYQEQSYLLDPFLERFIVPVVHKFRQHAKSILHTNDGIRSIGRIGRVALLLYHFTKFRGYKTIIRYFPHEIADLAVALNYTIYENSPFHEESHWPIRYIVLLWLSLICMLPFDFAQFDEAPDKTTFDKLEKIAKDHMGKPGVERSAAAVLISRLYMRKDTFAQLPRFIEWSQDAIRQSASVFLIIAILHSFAEMAKHGSSEFLLNDAAKIMKLTDLPALNTSLDKNTVIRKLKVKVTARIAVRILPIGLTGEGKTDFDGDVDYTDIPTEVEDVIQELIEAIQDSDTNVRWSAAKGLARITERLPRELIDQIIDTVVGLFSIHGSIHDSPRSLPTLAEKLWHGSALACAEMARRGLVSGHLIGKLMPWLLKALFFDIRKGAHSIGSNVRDAAAYVFWSLARMQDSVSALKPFSVEIGKSLVVVTLFDREISIRRAASAAFQESVGRTNLFVEGISILQETDFYAISNRRNAFLSAAPRVARFDEYKPHLIEHLLSIGLTHWDPDMRQLSSKSLVKICENDLEGECQSIMSEARNMLSSADTNHIHGGLLALTELARAIKTAQNFSEVEYQLQNIFKLLGTTPFATILLPRQHTILEATCYMISESITLPDIDQHKSSVPHWRKLVDEGMKNRNIDVQEAAAAAMGTIIIRDFSSSSPILQRSLSKFLGKLDYLAFPHGVEAAVDCLLDGITATCPKVFGDVEARRDAIYALLNILKTVGDRIAEQIGNERVRSIYMCMQKGLEDYTTTERGDVGSWIRIASLHGLCQFSIILFRQAVTMDLTKYLPPEAYHDTICGILKQSVERLDNVRQCAGDCFLALLREPLPLVPDARSWAIKSGEWLEDLFTKEPGSWKDGLWLFPKAVQMLNVQRYRQPVLRGLIFSLGSRTDNIVSEHRPLSSSFSGYVDSLPVHDNYSLYDLNGLTEDLLHIMQINHNLNGIFIPLLQALNVLFDENIFAKLENIPTGNSSLKKILELTSKNLLHFKNIQRIIESMKCITHLITFEVTRSDAISLIGSLLQHKYPKIRVDTAEFLYLMLQTKDLGVPTEDIEDILIGTEWLSPDVAALAGPAGKVAASLR